jgi:cardiolipin synthase
VLPWRLRYANLRSHRKLMVIDGRTGFTGGMNIREDCILELEPDAPTLDLHFRVEGPVVAELQRVLVEDWQFCTGESLDSERYFPALEKTGDIVARAIPDGPDRPRDPILWSRLAAMARARTRVRILTPYFVPEPTVVTALGMAASAGKRVDIVIPAHNNLRMVQWASSALIEQVLEVGCHVYLARGSFDHTKLMLVDDDFCQIGSANWDARSFRLNFEFDLECYGEALTAPLHRLFEDRLADSHEVTLSAVRDRSWPERLRNGLAALAAPYL